MERFAAAAAAGFTAVELQFPYDHAPSAVKAELEKHGLTMLGLNTPPGNAEAGEFGLACVPGREAEFAIAVPQGARLCGGDRRAADPRAGGQAPTGAAAGRRDGLRAQSHAGRRPGGGEEHHAADRADQCARPAGLLPQPGRARRRHHRQGGAAATSASSSISIMCRSSAAISRAGSRRISRSSAMCRWARCPRATSRTRAR